MREVRLQPEAERTYRPLQGTMRERIGVAVDALATEPRPQGAVKLAARDDFRIRVGDYRIVYAVDDAEQSCSSPGSRTGARFTAVSRARLSTFMCYGWVVNGGDLVYLARSRAGLTQGELGERAGMAQNAVSRIERGEVDAGFATVRRLVRACGFELEISLATRDGSYAREVRRRREMTPRELLAHGVRVAHAAQSMRRAALAGDVER